MLLPAAGCMVLPGRADLCTHSMHTFRVLPLEDSLGLLGCNTTQPVDVRESRKHGCSHCRRQDGPAA